MVGSSIITVRSAQAVFARANGQQNHNFVALGRRQPCPFYWSRPTQQNNRGFVAFGRENSPSVKTDGE